MNYQQHRNHVQDGDYPWPNCQFCERFVIDPALRRMRGECSGDPAETNRHVISLDEFDELAAEEAA
jgi:hypothetical protein